MQSRYVYFPVNNAQREWGLYATCAGHNKTEPRTEYPSRAHPDEYYFTWESGRILHEWQLILVEDGGGTCEFASRRKIRVTKGSLIVIPPECWHRYRPNQDSGWTTLWIGFNGELATRLAGGAKFNPEGEVRSIPSAPALQRLFSDTVNDILENGRDNIYMTAARIPILIAALAECHASSEARSTSAELMHRAQAHIKEHASETLDFESVASLFGLNYRTFRYLFAKETGSSPLHYQLSVRLARAKNLLRSSDMPVAEIAKALGFNSTWYFSHFFQKNTHSSPAAYRKRRSHPATAT